MRLPTTLSTLNTPALTQSRRALRWVWVVLAMGLACGLGSVSASAKPMTESAVQSRTIRSDEVGVVLQTRSGDSLREIAQYYSRQNNIPFKRALELLTQTNQAQFPKGNPNLMQVGTQLVLPKSTQASSPTAATSVAANAAVDPAASGATSAVVASTPTATPVAPTVTTESKPPVTAPNTEAAPDQVNHDRVSQLKAWVLRVPKSLWLIIIPSLLLSLLVWLLTRSSRRNTESVAIQPEPTAMAVTQTDASKPLEKKVSDDSIHAWTDSTESVAPVESPSVSADAQINDVQAKNNVVVPSEPIAEPPPELNAPESAEEIVDVKPEAAQEIEFRFKQALHGLTADQLDLRSEMAKAPVEPVMPKLSAESTPATTAVNTAVTPNSNVPNLDVNHLLRQYANQTAEKAGQSVNYYGLSERTRLQKWMSTQSIDDLLDHAQKAYAQSYPNVAHHILNEVILRGNATQSTQALDLRNQWHIQHLRQQTQNHRGH